MTQAAKRFTDLRAWQGCDTYKKAVYRLCHEPPLAHDYRLRGQLETAVAAAPAHVAEGFGVMARASLMESRNHLLDAVDKAYITEDTRLSVNALA